MTNRLNVKLSANKANRSVAVARVLPYLLVLVAFALRIYRIDYQSIWRDEGASFYLAKLSIPSIVTSLPYDWPPFYFILLHFWTRLTGFSELSGRFFSLIFGVLLVPSVYFVTRKVFGMRTALAATAITAFSPLYVVYSQEIRTYSMLPLLYLFIINKLYQLAGRKELAWREWIELATAEVLGMYLHYFSVFAVAYVNLFLAVLWLRNRGAIKLHRWLSSQVLVALSYAPWAWKIIETQTIEGLPIIVGAIKFDLVSLTWHFFIGGHDLRGHYLFAPLSSMLAIAFFIALLLTFRIDNRRHETMVTFCHWIVPVCITFIAWWWIPLIHPRYILMFTVPLFILMSRIIVVLIEARRGLTTLMSALVATVLMATFVLGLDIAYFDSGYFKDGAREVAEYLQHHCTADDIIIVYAWDYAIPYYYTGNAPIVMMDIRDPSLLEEVVQGKNRVFHAYPPITWRDSVLSSFLLEVEGKFVGGERFKDYNLKIYELGQNISLKVQPSSANFGDLRLTGASYQSEAEADDAICLALSWQLNRATKRNYNAVVILWDEVGRRLSSADVPLLNKRSLSTRHWLPGEEAVNYYIVPIPLGTPPLSYRITVGVYNADTLEGLSFLDAAGNPIGNNFPLGKVMLTKARDFERDPYGTRENLHLKTLDEPQITDGLALEGFAISKARLARTLNVTLRWRALRDGLPHYVPRLRLCHDDAIWAEVGSTLFEERYPTTEWAKGEVVFEQRDLVYPPNGGWAALEVEIDGKVVPLAEIELEKAELLSEIPPMQHEVGVTFGGFAELLGYDLDRTETTTSEKVRLILYWRAINEEPLTTSYTVFTHLLNQEGKLIGQHDSIPAGWTRPTTSWVPGEVIVDVHEMEFSDVGYRGKALVEVGMYDSLTIERVPTEEGSDHLILPSEVTVK